MTQRRLRGVLTTHTQAKKRAKIATRFTWQKYDTRRERKNSGQGEARIMAQTHSTHTPTYTGSALSCILARNGLNMKRKRSTGVDARRLKREQSTSGNICKNTDTQHVASIVLCFRGDVVSLCGFRRRDMENTWRTVRYRAKSQESNAHDCIECVVCPYLKLAI